MRVMNPIKSDFENQGVEFLAVNVWEDNEAARAFAESSGYDYRWAQTDEASIERLGIASIPTLIVIDQNGNVVWRSGLFTAFRGGADLRNALEDLTSGQTSQGTTPSRV